MNFSQVLFYTEIWYLPLIVANTFLCACNIKIIELVLFIQGFWTFTYGDGCTLAIPLKYFFSLLKQAYPSNIMSDEILSQRWSWNKPIPEVC